MEVCLKLKQYINLREIGIVCLLLAALLGGTSCASKTPIPKKVDSSESPQLQLINWRWYQSSDIFFVAEGKIKNVGKEDLDQVKAVFSLYDKEGNLLKNESADLESKTLRPGKVSLFRVAATVHPKACQARVDFRDFCGDFLAVDRNGQSTLKPITTP
ncbi:MAG TPA: hypothetical protein GXX39_08180 [Syntrophothermus lipocalidus]|nr:hypothetical protein [Syntrophothermus lipocalidus]